MGCGRLEGGDAVPVGPKVLKLAPLPLVFLLRAPRVLGRRSSPKGLGQIPCCAWILASPCTAVIGC